jgi:hypothetical protein
MKGIIITGLGLIAALAMSAPAASSVAAKRVTLATAKGPLSSGAKIVAKSSDLTTSTAAGDLKCSKSVLKGTLSSNKHRRDTASVSAATASGQETGGACTSPLGPAEIEASNLPWSLTFNGKGVSLITSADSAGEVAFKATFPNAGGVVCVYQTRKIKTQFPVSKVAKPVELTASNQVFTRDDEASSPACPESGQMNGHFEVTSGGKPVLAKVN